jgi:predicted amidohydrolase YtcJ
MEVLTSGRLREWALEADRHGLQLSVHAIGDRANDAILSIFEEIVRTNPAWTGGFESNAPSMWGEGYRAVLLPRRGGVSPPYHCIDEGVWAEQRIGAVRSRTTYAFKSFLDAGVRVCFGSDWTVAPLDPIQGVYAAVTRATLDGKQPGGWCPEQRLTVEEAVRCYTVNNAFAAFEEHLKGTLEPGKMADMVVLSENIFSVPPAEIRNVRVKMTVVDGEVVYG